MSFSWLRLGSVLSLAGALLPPAIGWSLPPAPAASSARETLGPPLLLDEAIAIALRLHPLVTAAHYTQVATQAGVGQAVAAWLPQVVGSAQVRGDFSNQFGSPAGADPVTSPAIPASRSTKLLYSGQLQLTQLLYDFGRTGGAIASNRAAARAASGDEQAMRAQVALATVTAYYGVLQAEAMTAVVEQNLDQQQQRQAQAESFFKTGVRSEIDVLIAKTAVAQAELQRVQAHNNILVARAQLVQSLGVTGADWLKRPLGTALPGVVAAESRPFDELLNESLHQRPDYYALRERVTQAEQQIRVSRGAYFPILALSATAGLNGTALGASSSGTTSSSGISTAAPGFGVTGIAGVSWPLFNGMNTFYTVRAAQASLEVAKANLEVLRQQVSSLLQQAVVALGTARQSEAAAAVVLQQAEKQLAMATSRYAAGVGSAIEVGDAEVTATMARAQRVQTQYGLALARANLQWQLGLLGQGRGAQSGLVAQGQE